MKIVIVEDSLSDSELIKTCLESFIDDDSQIVILDDGEKAWEYISSNHIDIKFILLDLNLPKIKGDVVLSKIKNDDKLKYIPVIIFTTSNNPDDVKRTYTLGTNSFITKPMGIKNFQEKIKDIHSFWSKHNTTLNDNIK